MWGPTGVMARLCWNPGLLFSLEYDMVLETLVQNITSYLLWLSYNEQEELGGWDL